MGTLQRTLPQPHPRGPWPWGRPILGLFLHHQPCDGSEWGQAHLFRAKPMLKTHSTESGHARPFGPGCNLPWFEVWTPASASWWTLGRLLNLSVPHSLPCIMGLRTVPAYNCVVRINEMMPMWCSAQCLMLKDVKNRLQNHRQPE